MTATAVSTHGVSKRSPPGDAIDLHAEELRQLGYTLVPSGLTAAELSALRVELDRVYEAQIEEVGGEEALAACNEIDVVRAPLAYSEVFVSVAANPRLLAVVARAIGESFVLMQQNALMARPANATYHARWHRDLSFQHWISTEPLALNALLAVDEFTLESGATFVLPASHLRAEFPSDAYVAEHERVLAAPPATFLVLDGMLFHRAGRNVSGRPRRAVNHLIGRPFLAQQFDFATMLGDRYAEDAFLSRYLGYRWRPQPDVVTWRRQRMVAAPAAPEPMSGMGK